MSDALKTLLASRKVWLMVVDIVVSLVTYFAGKYANPAAAQDILFVIAALQPVVISVIASITVQNVAGIKADGALAEANAYKITAITAETLPENKPGHKSSLAEMGEK